jgi:hypothetical protein
VESYLGVLLLGLLSFLRFISVAKLDIHYFLIKQNTNSKNTSFTFSPDLADVSKKCISSLAAN